MSYKPRTLFGLLEDINARLFLPHIQRPFVWEEDQMLRLFDSLMRNYPIQTMLLWRTKDEIKARRFMEEIDWDADLSDYYEPNVSKEGADKTFVLDGQQRLQTLFAVFKGALKADNGSRKEAYFDITSGDTPSDLGILYKIEFSEGARNLPWYRVADLLGRDSQRNAESRSRKLLSLGNRL